MWQRNAPFMQQQQPQQQKTSALEKPDVDLFITRTDRYATDTTITTNQPTSQSDSTQLKAGNCCTVFSVRTGIRLF